MQIRDSKFESAIGNLEFAAICLLCLLCLLTACTIPGSVRPTVKIGLVAPFEGRYRYIGYDVFPAVRLALREANAAGGVGGVAVELVAYDDGADPQMAAEQAHKLAVDADVVAALGHWRWSTSAAALPVYAGEGLPLLAPALLEPLPAGGEMVVEWGVDARLLAAAMLDRAGAAVLVDDGSVLGDVLQQVAAERGVTLRPVVAADVAQQASGASTVLCSAAPVACGQALAALRADGWGGQFLGGPELAAADFAAVAGAAAAETLLVTPWPPAEEVPGADEFAAAYVEVSGGPPPGPLARPAYEATRLLLAALQADVEAHGAPSRAGVAAALTALRDGQAVEEVTLYWYRLGRDGRWTEIE